MFTPSTCTDARADPVRQRRICAGRVGAQGPSQYKRDDLARREVGRRRLQTPARPAPGRRSAAAAQAVKIAVGLEAGW